MMDFFAVVVVVQVQRKESIIIFKDCIKSACKFTYELLQDEKKRKWRTTKTQ